MKRTAGIAATAALAVAFSALVATPAHAGLNDCPKGYVCVWRDNFYRTGNLERAFVKFQWYIPNYADYAYEGTGIGSTNTATSIVNNGRTDTAVMYANTSKRTELFQIPIGNRNGNLIYPQGDNIESGYYWIFN
jgi:hypothetical protein